MLTFQARDLSMNGLVSNDLPRRANILPKIRKIHKSTSLARKRYRIGQWVLYFEDCGQLMSPAASAPEKEILSMSGKKLSGCIRCRCIFGGGFSPGTAARLAAVLLALSAGWVSAAAPLQTDSTQAPPTPSAASSHAAQDTSSYRIGAGDVLEISVWNEPQASVPGAVVRPDGKISLPLIKEVPVIGLTPSELQQLLTSRLDKLIRGADITVVVKEIRSKKIYLVGQVSKIGAMPLTSDDTTVLQALSESGGLTPYAKKKKIYVLRKENGKQVKLPFDYDAVVKGEHMEQNITLLPDDTIVVP